MDPADTWWHLMTQGWGTEWAEELPHPRRCSHGERRYTVIWFMDIYVQIDGKRVGPKGKGQFLEVPCVCIYDIIYIYIYYTIYTYIYIFVYIIYTRVYIFRTSGIAYTHNPPKRSLSPVYFLRVATAGCVNSCRFAGTPTWSCAGIAQACRRLWI